MTQQADHRPGCGPDCPCRAEQYREADRSRHVYSTNVRYTMREVEPGVFRYTYLIDTRPPEEEGVLA